MKRIIAFPALLTLLLALCLPAAAADTDYTGVVDSESGEAYTEGSGASASGSGRSALSANIYYDWNYHDYVYPIGESLGEVHASAADGMVLSTPVSVDPGSDASVKVFYNGSEYTGNLRTLNQVGEYVVSAQVGGQNQRLLGFTLVGGRAPTSSIPSWLRTDSISSTPSGTGRTSTWTATTWTWSPRAIT